MSFSACWWKHAAWRESSSQFSVLSSQFSVLSSQFSVLSSQFSVLSSQFSVLSSQFSVLSNWTLGCGFLFPQLDVSDVQLLSIFGISQIDGHCLQHRYSCL